MGKWQVGVRGALERLEILAQLHVAVIVGTAIALASEVFATSAIAKILIGAAAAIATRQIGDLSGRGKRASCMRAAAANARGLLDRDIALEFDQRFPAGNSLSLRDIDELLDQPGALEYTLPAGGVASRFSEQIWSLRATMQTEVLNPCALTLRRSATERLERFVAALAELAVASSDIVTTDTFASDEAERIANAARYDRIRAAIREVVTAGNDVDQHGDPRGAAAAADDRAAKIAAARAREAHARDVLIENAREATASLAADGVSEMLERLRAAVDATRHADSSAFHDATPDVRNAHRKVTADLANAIVLGQVLEKDATDERTSEWRDAIAQIAPDVAALESLRPG
jgi:hypothetical protein